MSWRVQGLLPPYWCTATKCRTGASMKNAFVDKSGVLTAWGYMESNNQDRKIVVDDGFDKLPGRWREAGGGWVEVQQHQASEELAARRRELIALADERTLGMGDAFVAGLLDEEDKALFTAMAAYKLALAKLDLAREGLVWPVAPI
ncbi:hypothetical protein DDE05_00640 [Streptomyces cavourensis]|nr:hypothetical protein DDE05_00640 [Streptomyces cavourensis]